MRLRATPLFTSFSSSSSSKVPATLSFINVASCYWFPRRLFGGREEEEEEENEKKKKNFGKDPGGGSIQL